MKRFIPAIIGLTALDQLIKIVIARYFVQLNFNILADLVRFQPKQNTLMSWGGHYIGILSNKTVTVVINLLLFALLISGYAYYRSKRKVPSRWVNVIFISGFAGAICSLIDKLCWNGSLDYIALKGLFIFDLKDCYLSVAEVIFIFLAVKYSKEISCREYLKWCIQRLTIRKQR